MADTADTIASFIELFQGNRNAVGTETGGCLRLDDELTLDWEGQIEGHLVHGQPIGVYPMALVPVSSRVDYVPPDILRGGGITQEWRVHWGCIDYDEGEEESWTHAINTRQVLEQFGITGWIERSRSKGYHVWTFLADWTPASQVRTALLAAAQLAGAPTREINPKQAELGEGKLGNYVRLPYPSALSGELQDMPTLKSARVMYAPPVGSLPLRVEEFVTQAMESRCNAAALEPLGGLYQPPARAVAKRTYVPMHGEEEDAVRRMLPLTKWIYSNGPDENHPDRSAQLYRFARILGTDGMHTHDEMFALLVKADERWGKFSERDDRDQRLSELLDKALREA